MELNFNDVPMDTVEAGSITRGDLFKLPTGKTAYMRIHNPHKASYEEDISVVNLATGYSYEFPRSKNVIPLCGVANVSMDDC